jgi:hypothetical protein
MKRYVGSSLPDKIYSRRKFGRIPMCSGRLSLTILLKKVIADGPPLSGISEIQHYVCRGERDALSFSRQAES